LRKLAIVTATLQTVMPVELAHGTMVQMEMYMLDVGYVHWWSKKMWSSLSLGYQRVDPSTEFKNVVGSNQNLPAALGSGALTKDAFVGGLNLNYKLTSHLNVAGQYTYMRKKSFATSNAVGSNQIFGIYADFTF
jgi:hypothetical protein